MTTLVLIIMIFTEKPLGDWFYLVVLFYYIIAYHQLFGYGWWGSIWRTVLTGFEGFFLLLTLSMLVESVYGRPFFDNPVKNLQFIGGLIIVNAVILAVCYYISHITSRRAALQAELSQPEPHPDEFQDEMLQDEELLEDELLEDLLPIEEPQDDEFPDETLLEEEPLEVEPQDEEQQPTAPDDID